MCELPYKKQIKNFNRDSITRELEKGTRLNRPPKIDKNFYKIIQQCWLKDPNQRIKPIDIKCEFEKALSETGYSIPKKFNKNTQRIEISKKSFFSTFRQMYKNYPGPVSCMIMALLIVSLVVVALLYPHFNFENDGVKNIDNENK